MPKHNRNTLKSFFSDGAMPSSDMFEDLIDSTINLNDDGFSKTDKDGIKLANIGDYKSLMSFYDQSDRDNAQWQLHFEGQANSLVLGAANPQENTQDKDKNDYTKQTLSYALCIDKSQNSLKVGIGEKTPKDTLDVNGAIRSKGRRGGFGGSFQSVPANRQWHDATPILKSGVILEVVARAINQKEQRYGMMHAVAMHSPWRAKRDLFYYLGFKNRIRYTHAFYDSMLHKLKLRWIRKIGEDGYRLQIRSNCKYGDEGVLDYHITSLWSDEDVFEPIASATDDTVKPVNTP